ncbi:DUF3999 family protein [Granulicella tundricola]|uniref:DUF3999 family protein n=1 Tax=Granulicella tundricola TaxID=940615 RepID=UPI0003177196|nr:DUF3999 family protein [Granulicella tundricola]
MFKPLQLAALAFAFQAIPAPHPHPIHFAYQRPVTLPAGQTSRTCVTLDAPVFAHSNATLSDLRLYTGSAEVPYATTISESSLEPPESARILNLGERSGRITFDLQMPPRSYTQVVLDLTGANFLATAHVTGLHSADDKSGTTLGAFTLFDLTAQHLSRNTTIPLQESSFPYLHIDLAVTPAPASPPQTFSPTMVQGAQIPPTRDAQTLYTAVAETSAFTQQETPQLGRATVADITIPARIPVERITFTLAPGSKLNFSRPVRITATPQKEGVILSAAKNLSSSLEAPDPASGAPETITGEITQVRLIANGPEIHQERLSIPATLGANLHAPAHIQIAIQNGDDKPLPVAAVRLEMRQRKLCFDPPAGAAGGKAEPVTLAYGDPALTPPIYDYARLFNPAAPTRPAILGPEQPNPNYIPRPQQLRPFTERHPELLWVALLAVVAVLGVIAFRSARTVKP